MTGASPTASTSAPSVSRASPASTSAAGSTPAAADGSTSRWTTRCAGGPDSAGRLPSQSQDDRRHPASSTTSASRRARITPSPPISPPWPKNPGSPVGTTPRPICVVVAAAPSRAPSARSSAVAPARTTPPPATSRGRSAERSSRAASSTSPAAGRGAGDSTTGSSSAGSPISAATARTSAGSSRCTGPGLPDSASRTAARTSSGIRSGDRATALHFVVARIRPWTSAAIASPEAAYPRCVGAPEVSTSTARPFAREVPSPPTRLCAPGPISP